MFKDSNFDVLEFLPPFNGMNQNISRDILPSNFAYLFENLIPIPAGAAKPRFGTFTSISDPFLNVRYSIMKAFSFPKRNGLQQIVFYLSYFKKYLGGSNFTIDDRETFSFTPPSSNADFLEKDTEVRIRYNYGGGDTLQRGDIQNISYNDDGSISIKLKTPFFNENAEILEFFTSKGRIVIFDEEADEIINNQGVDNLHVGVVPYGEFFLTNLLLCNGIDPIYKWDGVNFERVFDFVKEQAISFNRIDDTHFSFTVTKAFIIEKYSLGSNIKLSIDELSSNFIISSISKNEDLVTIGVEENLPEFGGNNAIELFYTDYPPPFSFLKVINDRIFALPPGPVSLNYRNVDDCLRVYYTYQTNSLSNWFNENTKTVPSINVAAKHGILDNLEAISSFNGLTLFIGRQKTQVWSGQDPSDVQSENPFIFNSILPVGIVHGSLLNELANDIYFVSNNGILSFGTLNIAQQFAATSIDAVDPLVKQYVSSILEDDQNYRNCHSFKYDAGNFLGFRIGKNPVLIGFYTTNIYAWGLFSGDFQFSTGFLINLDGSLSLFINEKVYNYADGIKSIKVNGDRDSEKPIKFFWSFIGTKFKGKKFNNKFYELNIDYSSTFAVSDENKLSILISGDVPETFLFQDDYELAIRGDPFDTIALIPEGSPDPKLTYNYDIGMRFNIPYERKIERFKFIASDFYITIFGRIVEGDLSLKKLRLFGTVEK